VNDVVIQEFGEQELLAQHQVEEVQAKLKEFKA
jgi:hypothetical protein